jgi:hypothetical protein
VGSLSGLFQSIAFSIRFQDVASVSEPVKQCTGESLGAKDLGPFLEGQVGGYHEAVMLIGPANDFEEQLGPGLGERDISQFIDDQEMESLELFMQSLKPFFLPALHELSDQIGGCIESNVSSLSTRRKRQGTDQMRFTGSGVPMSNTFSLYRDTLLSKALESTLH